MIFTSASITVDAMTVLNGQLEDQRRRRTLLSVIGSAFGAGVSFGAAIPLLSLSLASRGFDAGEIGLNSAMAPLGAVCFSFLVPRILAQVGIVNAIIGSCVLAAALFMVFPALDSYLVWCALRFLMGCIGVVHWIASETWINLLARDDNRSRVMALYATVMAAGFVIGPLLLSVTGTEGTFPFVAVNSALLVGIVPVALVRSANPTLDARMPLSIVGVIGAVPMVMAAAFVTGFVDTSLLTLIPIYQMGSGHPERLALLTLSIFTAGNLVLQYPLGWIADRTNRRWTAIFAAAIVAICAASYPLLLPATGAVFWIMMFVWGGVSWSMYGLGLSLLGDSFRPTQLAAANAAFVMFYEGGAIVGPTISGLAMDYQPLWGLPIAIALIASMYVTVALGPHRG